MLHKACIYFCALSMLFFVAPLSYGQQLGNADMENVQARGVLSVDKVRSGSDFQVAAIVTIAKGYHINANRPSLDYLIPTKLELSEQQGLKFGKVIYPKSLEKKFEFSDKKLAVYEGKIIIGFAVTASKELQPGAHTIEAKLHYQACSNTQCFAPKTIPISIPFEVVSPEHAVNQINDEIFSQINFGTTSHPSLPNVPPKDNNAKTSSVAVSLEELKNKFDIEGVPTVVFIDSHGNERSRIIGFVKPEKILAAMKNTLEGEPTANGKQEQKGKGDVARLVEDTGYFLTFAIIFVWGLGLNLTPCVYPIIPITIGYFGGQSGERPRKVFVLACLYVLGIAITYSVLGVLAAMSGKMLGSWLQNPFLLIFVAAILIALALSMFGLYEFRMPNFLVSKGTPRKGFLGALFMGLVMGAVAAPCIGPFVLALFTFVAESRDPFLGFLMFFTLAMGLGVPYIFLGTFSGSINALPKSGVWMVWVKKIFGFVMIGMALYFLKSLPGISTVFWILVGTLCIVAGIYLGWIEGSVSQSRSFYWIQKATGVLIILIGIWVLLPTQEREGIKWVPYEESILQEAIRSGKPVMIDFYADWCLPCKELDKYSFKDSEVVKQSENFVTIKADLTRSAF